MPILRNDMPIFKPTARRQKILISPDYNGGWATYFTLATIRTVPINHAMAAWMLTYQPFIDILENRHVGTVAEAQTKFVEDAKQKFGFKDELKNLQLSKMPRHLTVVVVDGPFMVMEYDSAESVILLGQQGTVELPSQAEGR
ncbi:hypothetical protein LTR08_002568 [Meristemomyces frigidus]|nr:hypothetical protein LTR08_002568 [Meristemomyces frigidus]